MKVLHGDSIEILKDFKENSIDSIVTDGPYGLGFMGKDWDKFTSKEYQDFSFEWSSKALRVLKPGGYCLSFSAPKKYHRMVCGLEDAGFLIKDMINWVYGSGFPKSLDISKAIDKHYGKENERKYLYTEIHSDNTPRFIGVFGEGGQRTHKVTIGATKEAKQWEGWGTGLKPSHEPIVLAQKPYKGTYAENVLKWGVGGLYIDGCRIQYQPIGEDSRVYNPEKNIIRVSREASKHTVSFPAMSMPYAKVGGRWPSNMILTHHPECELIGKKKIKTSTLLKEHNVKHPKYDMFSTIHNKRTLTKDYGKNGYDIVDAYNCHPECPVRMMDEQSGELKSGGIEGKSYLTKKTIDSTISFTSENFYGTRCISDKGGASRFFKVVDYKGSFIKDEPLFKIWQKKMLGDILESQMVDGIVNGVIKEIERCILNLNIDGYGNKIMGKYLMNILFIIKTLTKQTINSKILNYYLKKNITFYIEKIAKIIKSLKELNIEDVKDVENISHLKSFIKELLELMEDTVKNVQMIILQNGEKKIENIGTNTIETTEKRIDRFFYCAKAHKSERNAGLIDIQETPNTEMVNRKENSAGIENPRAGAGRTLGAKNDIATLKPINLMRYLIRLVTPPNGIVLDPFAGSGTTGIACIIEGFNYILIEKRKRFAEVIIPKRLEYWRNPKNWELLKEHPLLPNIQIKIKKQQNKSIKDWT